MQSGIELTQSWSTVLMMASLFLIHSKLHEKCHEGGKLNDREQFGIGVRGRCFLS